MNGLESKTIRLRLVEINDAEFILSLRLNEKYNNFISKVNDDIEGQKKWIESYKKNESKQKEFYFIIERIDGLECGTVRIYDLQPDSFSWGSWILNEDKTRFSAIESAFLVYQFGFDFLNFNQSHFEVMKENKSVISFHEKMGATRVGETYDSFQYVMSKKIIEQQRRKFEGKLS